MMRQLPVLLMLALAASSCSVQPQQEAPPIANPAGPALPPVTSLPDNAPAGTVKNVPATTGRANVPRTPSPFAVATIGQFNEPFALAFLPDGRLLVTEKAGALKLRATDGQVTGVRGVPPVAAGGQGGLLDIAPAPDFAESHRIYLSYSEPRASGSSLALMRAVLTDSGSGATLTKPQILWRAGSDGVGGQFGATIAFAPDGQSLFLTSGERQRFMPAQDPDQALGKIVHLSLNGRPAPDNPMAGAGGVKAQTWSTGHRNPYGLVFTPDGRLWEEEMGPYGGDELNLIEPGRNYGWPLVSNGDNYSGQPIPDHPSRPEFAAPKLWWNPSISPGGMIYYSGAMFPEYRGSLLIAALSGESLIRITLDGATATAAEQWAMESRIRDVAQAPDGAIWLLEDGGRGAGGKLLRLSRKK
nr:PQQ-dependent sugar dehydrogenase [Sphingomonas sp.]